MKLQIIDGKPFILSRIGKRESVQTPTEFVNDAHKQIGEANQIILSLRRADKDAQEYIETSILNGDDVSEARSQQSDIRKKIADAERDQREAFGRIGNVGQMIDNHTASIIRQRDKDRLNQLLTPFNNFFKEYQA